MTNEKTQSASAVPTANLGRDTAADDLIPAMEEAGETLSRVRAQIGRVFFGQDEVVDQVLTVILAGGHLLLVGVPGLGKTLLVETLGTVLGIGARRIQFTPDLMPADILGSEVLEEGDDGKRAFRFVEGPVFTQLLMADEINRASPRTQSALLQAMQEGRISIAGHYHSLPHPFHVMATQNPIEQEGTYPLPEAQLDRFLCQVNITYPDVDAERAVVLRTTGTDSAKVSETMSAEALERAQRLVRQVPVGEKVVDAILALVRSARPESSDVSEIAGDIAWGPGPRASQALMLAARARSLLQGRLAPSVDDIAALAKPVLRHRMALTFPARAEGRVVDDVIDTLVERLG